jgi:hypothetical protein
MKKIVILTALLSISIISCKAQHIIPIEEAHKFKGTEGGLLGENNYVYVKDVNNVLGKFIGTWKGTYNAKNYEFNVLKIITDNGEVKKDKLLMRYKITDSKGTVIDNTLALPNDSPYVMKNGYIAKSGSYVFSYMGKEASCGQSGWVFMRILNNSNNQNAKLFLQVGGEIYPECTTGKAEQILPIDWIDLVKQ